MEELMTAVFIAHTKVLTAVRLSSHKKQKLSITVPKLDHFLHRVFCESARVFWKTPFLFMSDGGAIERQKNLLQIEALVSEAITTAVRGLLPVKQILHDYLDDTEDNDNVTASLDDEAQAEEIKPDVKVVKTAHVEEINEKVKEKEKIQEIKDIDDSKQLVEEIKEIKEKDEDNSKQIVEEIKENQVVEKTKSNTKSNSNSNPNPNHFLPEAFVIP